jgi:hypothetical protein
MKASLVKSREGRPRSSVLVAVLVVAWGASSAAAWAQTSDSASTTAASRQAIDEALLVAQRGGLAESILAAKEAARGEALDAAFRADLMRGMESLSVEQLAALAKDREFASITNALADTGADLVYTPVAPCRVFDSRSSAGGPGPLAVGSPRNVVVAGSSGVFPSQGGTAGGCGIPVGATSVMMNFSAVSPAGPGNLRAWAVASPQPAAPSAATMTYDPIQGALSNGIAVPICNPAATSCAADLRLQAFGSNTEVVGDVVGYFRYPSGPLPFFAGAETLNSSLTAGVGFIYPALNVNVKTTSRCLVNSMVLFSTPPTAQGIVYAAYRPNGTVTNTRINGRWCFPSTPAPNTAYYSCSVTVVAAPTGSATNQYDFGCDVNLSGAVTSAYCQSTVLCF